MTVETLNRASDILSDIEWAKSVLRHMAKNHRMTLRFNTTRECIESHDETRCPEWLEDVICDAVEKKKNELTQEFEKL